MGVDLGHPVRKKCCRKWPDDPKHHQRLAQVFGIAQQRRGRRKNWQDGNLIEFATREKISSWTGNEKSHVVKLRKKGRNCTGNQRRREINGCLNLVDRSLVWSCNFDVWPSAELFSRVLGEMFCVPWLALTQERGKHCGIFPGRTVLLRNIKVFKRATCSLRKIKITFKEQWEYYGGCGIYFPPTKFTVPLLRLRLCLKTKQQLQSAKKLSAFKRTCIYVFRVNLHN